MKLYRHQEKLMGSAFELGVVAVDPEQAQAWLKAGVAEIQRIENLFSVFRPDSTVSRLNEQAHTQAIKVEGEVMALLQRSQSLSQLTRGDFDITVGPLKELYQFKKTQFTFPKSAHIKETLAQIGYQHLKLNPAQGTVRFDRPGLQIGFAAIGKGYASDKVKALWQQNGVKAGYINASGDLNAFGRKPDGTLWKIGIAHPEQRQEVLLYVPLEDGAVATSGDYEQHFTWKAKRYSHNLNPHTGLPLSGIRSVSIFAPSAELADALATAVYVKGVEKGLAFVERLPQTHAIIITDTIQVHFSSKLKYETIAT